jgi:hypothetical protein
MEEFTLVIHEIDTILTTGRTSLDSLSAGVKVKGKYAKIISRLIEAVNQLEFGHGIDFGTVMMGLLCSSGIGTDGELGLEHQTKVLSNLEKLHNSTYELARLSKKISLLGSFVTSKTLFKLKAVNEEEGRDLKQGFFNRIFRGSGTKAKSAPAIKKQTGEKMEADNDKVEGEDAGTLEPLPVAAKSLEPQPVPLTPPPTAK